MKLIEGKVLTLDIQEMDLSYGMVGKVKVIENPTNLQFRNLYFLVKDIRGLATLKNVYIWDANVATHDEMQKQLLKQCGIEITDPYCGFIYTNNKLGVDGYQYIKTKDYDADPNEMYAKNILLKNQNILKLFDKDLILNAKNHHTL